MNRHIPWLPVFVEAVAIVLLVSLSVLVGCTQPGAETPQQTGTVLRTSRILDGRGGVLEDRDIVIRDGRIAEIVPAGQGRGDQVHDLRSYTVLPGLIETHVHLGWHFGADGRLERGGEMADRVMYAAENAQRMLEAGFTTVQSLGGSEDGPLARALDRGVLPGPRILTSLGSMSAGTGGPAELRAAVRDFADRGAHVIKIFGSESIRTGGGPTMSQDQIDAACGEAAALGLRAVVHAHGPESARRATLAGCTTIEHGALLDRETLELMAEHGTFYDPKARHARHRAHGDALATARVLLRLLDEASGRGVEDLATLQWYLKRRRQRKEFNPDQYSLELPGYEPRRGRHR